MDTHWLRIALMTAFALAVLVMLIRAVTSSPVNSSAVTSRANA
jgi:hypothetical protein